MATSPSPFPFGFFPATTNAPSHVYSPSPSYHYAAAYPPPPPGFVPAPMYAPTPIFPPPPFGFGAPPYSPHPSHVPYPPPAQAYGPFRYYPAAATPVSDSSFSGTPTTSLTLPTLPTSRLPSGGAPAGRPQLELHTQEVPCTPENNSGATFPIQKRSGACYPAMHDLTCQGREAEEDDGVTPSYGCTLQNKKSGSDLLTNQPQSQLSLDTIPGELAKLTAMASQLVDSVGKLATSGHTSTPVASAAAPAPVASQVFGELPTPSSCNGTCTTSHTSSASSTAVAYIAPKVFDSMPAQNSWHGTNVIAPEYENYCNGYQNHSQSSCVQHGSTKLSEQYLDEFPLHYGFDSLSRRSVFRADGSEHSYFTLPADYPLERVPAPVFDVYADETEDCSNVFVDVLADSFGQSNAFVDVLARNSVQQPYEVEQRQSHQAPKCFSNPNFSPERPIVGTIGVFSLTNEQSTGELEKLNDSENLLFVKQDIEQFLNCSCTAPLCSTYKEECQGDENILWVKSACQTSTGNSISFYPWDPGASTPPYSSKFGAVVQRLRDPSRNVLLVVPERRQKWDPSIRKTIMDIPHDVKWYFRIQVSSHLSMLCDPGASLPPLSINTQQPDQAFRPTIHASTLIGNFEKLRGHEYVALLADSNVTGFSKYTCLSFWVQNNIVLLWKSEIAWPKQSVGTGASSVWDPGIWSLMDMLLGNAAVPNLVPSGLHLHKIQLADCAAIHACNLGFALLPHTQITASGSSNLEVHELASPYVGFHLHPITKWTSTPPNGFQKNYNAKNLISSQNYLQLSEMDIIFTTFLPP